MVIKQSIYSKRRPYQFGDATKRFIANNPYTETRSPSNVPWATPVEDLGQLPSIQDQTATRA